MNRPFKAFPGHRWGPDGEMAVFECEEDVPEGWTDRHPSHVDQEKPAPATPKPSAVPLTREQIMAALDEREIKYPRNSSTVALYKTLLQVIEDTES